MILFRKHVISNEPRSRHRRRTERGAVFIEFALAVPFLVMMGLGVVEGGMTWRAATDVNSVARDAARSGTSATVYALADQSILRSVGSGLSGTEMGELQRVIVFNATTGLSAQPTSSCLGIPATGDSAKGNSTCNVYSPSQVIKATKQTAPAGAFSTLATCGTWDVKWCPKNRNHSLANGNLDYLGVFIEIKHKSITGFPLGNATIRRTSVFRLEPAYGGT